MSTPAVPAKLDIPVTESPSARLKRRSTVVEGQSTARLERLQLINPVRDARVETRPEWLREEARLAGRVEPKLAASMEATVEAEPNVIAGPIPDVADLVDEVVAQRMTRRRIFVGVPSTRTAWPDRKSISRARDHLQAQAETISIKAIEVKTKYVDVGVQTELGDCECSQGLVPLPQPLPPMHSVSIGSMSDFFRGQYRLGDALRYV